MTAKMAFLCLTIGMSVAAQSKPDFSGTWRLNVQETEFVGAKPSAERYRAVRTIEQRSSELRLKVERVFNSQTSGFGFVTIPIGTGKSHVSDEAGIITAEWRDESLHFDYLYNPGTERESQRTEDWTLSRDGKKLIDREWVKRPDGSELRYTVVFDRQP
jgi:hypothetical protein